MPTLATVHLQTQARLREIVAAAIATIWQGLGSYDERDVDRFVELAVPVVLAGQVQSVALTEAYIVRRLQLAPIGLDTSDLTGAAVRGGVALEEVYRRPFVNVWTALGKDEPWDAAVDAGEARATASAEMDVQLAHRASYGAIQRAEPRIKGYRRRANAGACSFCRLVNGAKVKRADAMPLHNRCGCGLDPILADDFTVSSTPDGVAIHEHGELGPLLTDPAHDFTGPSDI
jgi:hypothetical protein